jgi:hypothetical protein
MTRALIPLLSLAGLAAAAAAERATVRIPAPFSIDDAHVTVAPAADARPGVTAYGFTAQQSGVARASYDAEDAGDAFSWRMVMTVDGRVGNDTEYHTTMTAEQACGLVTMDADGGAARGRRVFLDPCTLTGNQTTGVGEARSTETVSRVMSFGIAGLAALGKGKQSELVLDTVTVAGGKFVNVAATPASSELLRFGGGCADLVDLSTTADLVPTTAETDAPTPTKTGKDKNSTTTGSPPKASNQKSTGSSVAVMVMPALLGLGVVLAL